MNALAVQNLRHNFKTKKFQQKPVVTFEPCMISASSIFKVLMEIWEQTDRKTDRQTKRLQ